PAGDTLKAAPDAPFPQKPIVVPLNEVRLHLPHRVQKHPDDDQEARSAKKSRSHPRYAKPGDHGFRDHCDDRQEERSGESQSSQSILEKFRSRLPWSITGNVTIIFFQIIRDLCWLKLNRHLEIAEEEYKSPGQGIMPDTYRQSIGKC